MTARPEALARAELSLDGLSIGDAFGQRFMHPAAHALLEARELPAPPWRWTDDTAMALSIVDVLRQHGTIQQDALADAFAVRWAADQDRGYGGGAFHLLHLIALGRPWREVSRALFEGGSMGNGAAMRVAPLGAFHADRAWSHVRAEASASAEITHAHAEGIASAIAVAIAAAAAARGEGDAIFDLVLTHTPASATRDRIDLAARLDPGVEIEQAVAVLGNGSTILAQDTVAFCLWCAARHVHDFEGAMWTTVAGLGDIDTNCAIVGGIVACAVGRAGLPAAWLAAREPIS